MRFRTIWLLAAPVLLWPWTQAACQRSEPPAAQPPPAGRVVVSSDRPPPPAAVSSSSSSQGPVEPGPPDALPRVPVTDDERAALALDRWELDVHLIPAEGRMETHAGLTVRNRSNAPLTRLALQLSSTLRWQSVAIAGSQGLVPAAFTQSPIATDTDHTGYAQEAAILLAEPLAPGASVRLSVFYTGTIRQSAARLELLGTAPDRAARTDWDAIVPTTDAESTALRGFGDVLWYPVAAPAAVLGDGNRLFDLIARERVHEAATPMALRLTIEYSGDPPNAAVFNGRLAPLASVADDGTEAVEQSTGIATVSFDAASPGLGGASLFLTAQHAQPTADQLLEIVTPRPEAAQPYARAAEQVAPLLAGWFGPTPIAPLLLLDHAGEPYEDNALLVGQLAAEARPLDIAPLLVGGLTHAWFHSVHPWIAEGLAQWMRSTFAARDGISGAAELDAEARAIAFAEPDLDGTDPDRNGTLSSEGAGQPLLNAVSPVFYRTKAAAVWRQLRVLVGDEALRRGLIAYRNDTARNAAFDADPRAMQAILERVSGKQLGWFFDDWVYRDRGLPDLTITQVNPRALPARPGKNAGYLVAVEVRNDGDAAADVPVTVRAGTTFASTERLRLLAHSSASTRVLFEGTPEAVEVNDGTVPEMRSSTHRQAIAPAP